MKVDNRNNKGNPYHDDATGEFTSPGGGSTKDIVAGNISDWRELSIEDLFGPETETQPPSTFEFDDEEEKEPYYEEESEEEESKEEDIEEDEKVVQTLSKYGYVNSVPPGTMKPTKEMSSIEIKREIEKHKQDFKKMGFSDEQLRILHSNWSRTSPTAYRPDRDTRELILFRCFKLQFRKLPITIPMLKDFRWETNALGYDGCVWASGKIGFRNGITWLNNDPDHCGTVFHEMAHVLQFETTTDLGRTPNILDDANNIRKELVEMYNKKYPDNQKTEVQFLLDCVDSYGRKNAKETFATMVEHLFLRYDINNHEQQKEEVGYGRTIKNEENADIAATLIKEWLIKHNYWLE